MEDFPGRSLKTAGDQAVVGLPGAECQHRSWISAPFTRRSSKYDGSNHLLDSLSDSSQRRRGAPGVKRGSTYPFLSFRFSSAKGAVQPVEHKMFPALRLRLRVDQGLGF